jgi:hypothetical protein
MKKRNVILGVLLIMSLAMSSSLFAQGHCLDFDGTDDYVNLYSPTELDNLGRGSYTIEAWIKTSAVNTRQCIVGNYDGTPAYVLELHSTGNLRFYVNNTGYNSTAEVDDGLWHHVAGVRDYNNDIRLYVDGTEIYSYGSDSEGSFTVTHNTMIGRNPSAGYALNFDGLIEEVRIWNDVRSETEINSNMYNELVGNEQGLVTYYKLNEGSGQTADDSAGNNDGILGSSSGSDSADPSWIVSDAPLSGNLPPIAAVNLFPANLSENMPRTVTLSWRKGETGDDPTGFKVFMGSIQQDIVSYTTDIIYNYQLSEQSWEAAVSWKIVPYNAAGDCNSLLAWSYDVMADSGGTPPTEVVYYELEEVTVTEPPTMTLPTITLGGEDIQPTVDFTFDSAPASFTLSAIVQDQPDNPVPNPENCGGALLTNLPNGNPTRIVFYFSTSVTPDGIYHWNGSFWADITSTSNPAFSLGQVAFDWTSAARGNEEFAVNNGDGPLPINLSSFTAVYANGSSLLHWSTQSETNNLGWNVYRSPNTEIEEGFQINANIIEGAGTTTEQTHYVFADEYETYPNNSYWYWIESVDNGGTTILHGPARIDIPEGEDELPPELIAAYGLAQNFPNPFNPTTKIAFKLTEANAENAKLIIYNSKGQIVKTFDELTTNASELGSVTWNGDDENGNAVSSGIYMYKLKTVSKEYNKKMIMMK